METSSLFLFALGLCVAFELILLFPWNRFLVLHRCATEFDASKTETRSKSSLVLANPGRDTFALEALEPMRRQRTRRVAYQRPESMISRTQTKLQVGRRRGEGVNFPLIFLLGLVCLLSLFTLKCKGFPTRCCCEAVDL